MGIFYSWLFLLKFVQNNEQNKRRNEIQYILVLKFKNSGSCQWHQNKRRNWKASFFSEKSLL